MKQSAYDAELLDGHPLDPDVLEHSLAQVAGVNRWLGVHRGLRRALVPLLTKAGEQIEG